MTEQEWLQCEEPAMMLGLLEGRHWRRKLMLFAVACCYRVWDLLPRRESRRNVEMLELYADGLADEEDVHATSRAADEVQRRMKHLAKSNAARAASSLRMMVTMRETSFAAGVVANLARTARQPDIEREGHVQKLLLRCIIGSPFLTASTEGTWISWNDGTIPKIAQAIYLERCFGDMPILADALEDAGCTDATILDHLRGPGPHVRGCWVLDLILGKS